MMFFLPTKVNLGFIKINEVGLGSTFTIGRTQSIGRNNSNKKNQGFGQQVGDMTSVSVPIHIVKDADIIDSTTIHSQS
ncbi:hypothetical protein [Neobacillus sp. PS3-40]|uniref:hypothetical protein n=1 Tax=Neobacillus sp. PS3-40 TaxID=3070679 RepID=UPI0027E1BDE7|nr:hypothetical protein [Neobacillus sp. PS3-40]WML44930.1 hypothetical protein RCG20_03215 [Neobacillus sp. PS3-40]